MDVHTDRLNINSDWKLPEKILPSAWSEKNVMVAQGNAKPGRISYTDAAFQKLMIDAAEDRAVTWLTFMSAAQVGKTQVGLLAYGLLHHAQTQIYHCATRKRNRNP